MVQGKKFHCLIGCERPIHRAILKQRSVRRRKLGQDMINGLQFLIGINTVKRDDLDFPGSFGFFCILHFLFLLRSPGLRRISAMVEHQYPAPLLIILG